MNELITKLVALWLAGMSPDGSVPVTYTANHDADTIKVGFACSGPVTATISFTGLSMVQAQAGAKPLQITIPCLRGTLPMDVRVSGIDTPEIGLSGCPTQAERERERAIGLAARNLVTGWLRNADQVTLHDIDTVSEKWGRTLARVSFGTPDQQYDLGARLILTGNAHPYSGGTKQPWCGF